MFGKPLPLRSGCPQWRIMTPQEVPSVFDPDPVSEHQAAHWLSRVSGPPEMIEVRECMDWVRQLVERMYRDQERLAILSALVGRRPDAALEAMAIYLIRTGNALLVFELLRGGRDIGPGDVISAAGNVWDLIVESWPELPPLMRQKVRADLRRLLWVIRGDRVVDSWAEASRAGPIAHAAAEVGVCVVQMEEIDRVWNELSPEDRAVISQVLERLAVAAGK
jgi:hypothetical protein